MRTRRAGYNLFAYAIAFIFNAVVTLVTAPILLAGLNATSFGIWKTLQKVFDIASVADGRSSQVLKMLIARTEIATIDVKGRESVGAALIIWLIYLPLAAAILVTIYLNLSVVIGVPESEISTQVKLLFLFLSISFLLAPLTSIPDAVLLGSNIGYWSIFIQTAGMVAINIATIYFVKAGFDLYGVGLVSVTGFIFTACLMTITARRLVPWFSVAKPEREVIIGQARITVHMNVWLFIEKIILSAEIVLVASICGPTLAASYSFMTYIPQLVIALVLIIGSSVMPGLAALHVAEPVRAKTVIRIVREVVVSVSVFLVCFYLFFNKTFITLWVGEKFLISQTACVLLGFAVIQIVHIRNEAQIQDTILSVRKRLPIGVLGVLLSITIALISVNCFEFDKVVIVIASGIIGRAFIGLAYSKITDDLFLLDKDYIQSVVVALMLFCVAAVLSFLIPVLNYYELALAVLVVTPILMLCIIFLLISNTTRCYLLSKFRSLG